MQREGEGSSLSYWLVEINSNLTLVTLTNSSQSLCQRERITIASCNLSRRKILKVENSYNVIVHFTLKDLSGRL